jgi:c-di-GMP-binding flagellar brake protein YcgR
MAHDHDKRRKYRRHDRRLPCEYRIAGQEYRSFITDFSAGGFFIVSSLNIEPNTEILVTIELDPGISVVITGHVARRRSSHRSISVVNKAGLGVAIESAPEDYYQFVLDLEDLG